MVALVQVPTSCSSYIFLGVSLGDPSVVEIMTLVLHLGYRLNRPEVAEYVGSRANANPMFKPFSLGLSLGDPRPIFAEGGDVPRGHPWVTAGDACAARCVRSPGAVVSTTRI